jgi:hypothetical protein
VRLPPALLPAVAAILLVGGTGPNWSLALLALAVLLVGASLLWRPGETPVLLFVFGFQWLQGSLSIFKANWENVVVGTGSPYPGSHETAAGLTLLGLGLFAIGLRLGAGPTDTECGSIARKFARKQQLPRVFQLYICASVASACAMAVAVVIPGLSQPIGAFANLKWAFFFIMGYVSMLRGGVAMRLFAIAFCVEFMLGLGGYFSEFKTVFFITILATVAAGARPSPRAMVGIALLGVLVIGLGVIWTAIKGDYRNFVSGEQATQSVTVDYTSQLSKIIELTSEIDHEKLTAASDVMLQRVTYIEFFASVLDYVPQYVPHEGGAIMIDALMRPFMPRIIFADKSVIDDSERTNKYTGLEVAGADRGTSISLGWIAETYIDFGEYGMMLAILFLGYFYGTIYRWLLRWSLARGLLGMGLATAVLLPAVALESSMTKVIGGVAVSLLVTWLLVAYGLPRFFPWVVAKPG